MDIEKILNGLRACECIVVGQMLGCGIDKSFYEYFQSKEDDVGKYDLNFCSKCLCKWRNKK
jgi:hypothetical protein